MPETLNILLLIANKFQHAAAPQIFQLDVPDII